MPHNSLPQYRPPDAPLPPLAMDQSRERAIKLLSDGYAFDRLSETEFEWRLGRLNSLESPAQVDALVADLLTPPAINAPHAVAPHIQERRIMAVMSSSRHEGVWMVPSALDVAAVMSDVKIDLRYANIPAVCKIDVGAVMADVTIIVPPGMPVHFDVNALIGSTRNDSIATNYSIPGVPLITVTGYAFLSEVKVRVRELGR